MTMEQANEKAKKLEQSSEAKPVAASLPRLAEGNFRTMPVQTVTATTPSGSRPAVTAHPEQKLLAPRPLFTAAREVKTIVPVSSVAPVTPPRPLRTGEQTAALWIQENHYPVSGPGIFSRRSMPVIWLCWAFWRCDGCGIFGRKRMIRQRQNTA